MIFYKTDEEIELIVKKMEEETGGWIFHSRIDFSKPTPSIEINKKHPKIMNKWLKRGSDESK